MPRISTRILDPASIDEASLIYVVIAAREKGKWVFVRHRERLSWEMPAGHIEKNEPADEAARRELGEETGAFSFTLEHLCDYQVVLEKTTESGRLYSAEIHKRKLKLEHEIAELKLTSELPTDLTYPEVQTVLFSHAESLLRS